jgi:IS5 family transposase
LTESGRHSGECCCASRRSCTTQAVTPRSTQRSSRETASKHYCRRTNYRVQTLKTTALVDTESHAILDVHCTTEKRHDTQLGWQVARRNAGDLASLAADKGYDWMELREKLREEGVRPLIKHREFRPIDHAHDARDRWASLPPTIDV